MIRPESSYRNRAAVEFDNRTCTHFEKTCVASTKAQAHAKSAGSLSESVAGSVNDWWIREINAKVARPPAAPTMTDNRPANQDDRIARSSSLNVPSILGLVDRGQMSVESDSSNW